MASPVNFGSKIDFSAANLALHIQPVPPKAFNQDYSVKPNDTSTGRELLPNFSTYNNDRRMAEMPARRVELVNPVTALLTQNAGDLRIWQPQPPRI